MGKTEETECKCIPDLITFHPDDGVVFVGNIQEGFTLPRGTIIIGGLFAKNATERHARQQTAMEIIALVEMKVLNMATGQLMDRGHLQLGRYEEELIKEIKKIGDVK